MPKIRRYKPPPIIVRTIRKSDDAFHQSNPTWKVAYADMVTALMAFFLLLWLYSALSQKQKGDIAQYFAPTPGIIGSAGIGHEGGQDAALDNGVAIGESGEDGMLKNQLKSGQLPGEHADNAPENKEAESTSEGKNSKQERTSATHRKKVFMAIEMDIRQMLENDSDVMGHSIVFEENRNGLKISLVDDPKEPVFVKESAMLNEGALKNLTLFATIIATSGKTVEITSHTAYGPDPSPHYSLWDLSIDRAHALRRFLIAHNVPANCIMQVSGTGDHDLLIPNEPGNERNNRIVISVQDSNCYP